MVTLKQFVEGVAGATDEETFISIDERVEIIHYCDPVGLDHFEYHTANEESGEYSTIDKDLTDLTIIMSQDLFDLEPDQVQGYLD